VRLVNSGAYDTPRAARRMRWTPPARAASDVPDWRSIRSNRREGESISGARLYRAHRCIAQFGHARSYGLSGHDPEYRELRGYPPELGQRRIFVNGQMRPRARRSSQVGLEDVGALIHGNLFKPHLLATTVT